MAVKVQLIAAWLLATGVAVLLAYQAVGLVQTQVTEGPPVLAAVEPTSTTARGLDSTVALTPDPQEVIEGLRDSETTTPDVVAEGGTKTPSTQPAPSITTTSQGPATSSSTTTPQTTHYIIPSGGGTVTVYCSSDTISVGSALANPGFRHKVHSEGPDEVHVTFEHLSERREFVVKASCDDGKLDFDVEEED